MPGSAGPNGALTHARQAWIHYKLGGYRPNGNREHTQDQSSHQDGPDHSGTPGPTPDNGHLIAVN